MAVNPLCTPEQFQAWRHETGMGQPTVAKLFGVTTTLVQHWEHGRSKVPERVVRYLRREGGLPPVRTRRPPQRHEPLCPVEARCGSCSRRRLYQSGFQAGPRRDAWTSEQDARLHTLLHLPSWQIAERLTSEFGIARTVAAVYVRCRLHGWTLSAGTGHSLQSVGRLFGVQAQTIQRWAAEGRFTTSQHHPKAQHTITDTQIEGFIRQWYPAIDLDRMPRVSGAHSRWRLLVEKYQRHDPPYTAQAAAPLLGLEPARVRARCRAGHLRGYRVPSIGGQTWRIPHSAIVTYLAAQAREARSA